MPLDKSFDLAILFPLIPFALYNFRIYFMIELKNDEKLC